MLHITTQHTKGTRMIAQKIKSIAWKIFMQFFEKPLTNPSEKEQEQISELRSIFLTLPDADEKATSEAERAWNNNLNRLKNKVMSEDPREFLRWDVVRKTMFVGNAEYINVELKYLKSHREWDTRWKNAIHESRQGCPAPYYRYMKSSGNLIHHAYHLARFENKTGLRINQLSCIFEFGGGYGSMCRLVHNLGFKGKYVIFDLPNFSHLQRYYFNSLGLQVKPKGKLELGNGIYCLDNLKDFESAEVGGEGSLFIATWSLSESPLYIRETLLNKIVLCRSQLIAYQDDFGEVDNVNYFSSHPEFNSCRNLNNEKINHLPNSRYLFGWSK